MREFKWRQFEGTIILWAVRWYCRYGISYRDLEQMMGERGVPVDHSTIYRWVQRYAPEMDKRLRWQWRQPRSTSWRVDETYVKVRGQWTYLYRALDKHGNTIDFYLSPTFQRRTSSMTLPSSVLARQVWPPRSMQPLRVCRPLWLKKMHQVDRQAPVPRSRIILAFPPECLERS